MIFNVREDIKKIPNPWARISIGLLLFFGGVVGGLYLRNENDIKKEYRAGIIQLQIRCDSMHREDKIQINYQARLIDTLYMGYKRGNEQVKVMVKEQEKHLK